MTGGASGHDEGRNMPGTRLADFARLADRARFIRLQTLRLSRIAGAGHYSGTFSAAELLATLYYYQLRYDPGRPDWPGRDRFVLSKGHAAIGLYPVLADVGFFEPELLDGYTRLGSPFGDHPDMRKVSGVDFSSGSLGHGLSVGVGMALGGRVRNERFGVYVMVGDGELAEGQVWEAAMSAAHYQLGALVCIVDRNQLCIDGFTEDVMAVEPIEARFASFGWDVQRIDGHDLPAIVAAFDRLAPAAAGQDQSDVFRGRAPMSTETPPNKSTKGTRGDSVPAFVAGTELADLTHTDPRIVVLTADLASANRLPDFGAAHPDRFFNMGIAEKNMVTAAAGMASTGLIPYVGTFAAFAALLCFEQIRTDCAYPGMPVRVLAHHSGISLGYYGTSHHALEDLAAMRAVANLIVVCAADANQLRAILRLSLTTPGAMYIRLGRGRDAEVYSVVPDNFEFGRAIRLRDGLDATIIATGSEVAPALQAADLLGARGCGVRVLDMHTIKPLDVEAVLAAATETGAIITVEEHNVTGGLGGAVAEALADHQVAVPFRRHGINDEYAVLGPPAALYALYRLDPEGIAGIVEEVRGGRERTPIAPRRQGV